MIALEKAAMDEDFGECEQCKDLPNINVVVKAHFIYNDCDLKICGPCEIAQINTKATWFHMIEPLLKINLVHRSIPQFANPLLEEDILLLLRNQSPQPGLTACLVSKMIDLVETCS